MAESPHVVPTSKCPALPPLVELSSEQVIVQHGTGVDPYWLEGGVWLRGLPVLINEDFDFAVAMGMEGIGPGIAAAQRKGDNEQKANDLHEVELAAGVLDRIEELRTRGVHVFFVLWGKEQALLRLVVEEDAGCKEHTEPRVNASAEKPLAGQLGWGGPGVLSEECARLLQAGLRAAGGPPVKASLHE